MRATIAFARGLGLAVTAEGIETPAQLRQLASLHCDLGQGYLFAGPLKASEMRRVLNRRAFVVPQQRTRAGR